MKKFMLTAVSILVGLSAHAGDVFECQGTNTQFATFTFSDESEYSYFTPDECHTGHYGDEVCEPGKVTHEFETKIVDLAASIDGKMTNVRFEVIRTDRQGNFASNNTKQYRVFLRSENEKILDKYILTIYDATKIPKGTKMICSKKN
jgi:hypothetical protein